MADFSPHLIPTNAKNTAVSTPTDDFHPDGGFWRQQYNNFLNAVQTAIASLQDSLTALSTTIDNLSTTQSTQATTIDDLNTLVGTKIDQAGARSAISVTGNGLSYNPTSGVISSSLLDGKDLYDTWIEQPENASKTLDDFFAAFKGDPGAGVNMRGLWSSTNTYEVNDAITFDGSAYVCIQQSINQEPSNSPNYWTLWISKGIKGDTGKNAYQLWVEEGNTGSVQTYLDSLKGESAFELWLEQSENAGKTLDDYIKATTVSQIRLDGATFDANQNAYIDYDIVYISA